MGPKIIVLIDGVSSGIRKAVARRLIGEEYAVCGTRERGNPSDAVAEVDSQIPVRKDDQGPRSNRFLGGLEGIAYEDFADREIPGGRDNIFSLIRCIYIYKGRSEP